MHGAFSQKSRPSFVAEGHRDKSMQSHSALLCRRFLRKENTSKRLKMFKIYFKPIGLLLS
jgi:hypothetical protein